MGRAIEVDKRLDALEHKINEVLLILEDLINKNDYKVTTWREKRNDPKDCNKPMWEIPFWDIYESM